MGADLRMFKYPLAYLDAPCFDDTIVVDAPFIRGLDHIGVQDGMLTLWSLVSDGAPGLRRRFYIAGTGQLLPSNIHYLGTVHHRVFVWHVFELIPMEGA
jgi:hypothetical protein